MNHSKEIIKKIYRSLPNELSQIVATRETSAINDDIAKMYNLNKQQRLEIGDEVTMRLLGITPEKLFVSNLENRLKIQRDIAEKIANEIKIRILSKIPEKILVEQEKNAQAELQKSTVNAPASVPEIPPTNLPMVEPGETVHEVPHVETKTETPTAQIPANKPLAEEKPQVQPFEKAQDKPVKNSYPAGQDPYREPLR